MFRYPLLPDVPTTEDSGKQVLIGILIFTAFASFATSATAYTFYEEYYKIRSEEGEGGANAV